jgi:hypothetical protein
MRHRRIKVCGCRTGERQHARPGRRPGKALGGEHNDDGIEDAFKRCLGEWKLVRGG